MNITKDVWKELSAILEKHKIPCTTHFENEYKHIQINLNIPNYVESDYEDGQKMYFITVFNNISTDSQTKTLFIEPSRVVGYYSEYSVADYTLTTNACDMHERIYHYAVIEEIVEGIYPDARNRWFYKYNKESGGYCSIEEPIEFKNYGNIAFG